MDKFPIAPGDILIWTTGFTEKVTAVWEYEPQHANDYKYDLTYKSIVINSGNSAPDVKIGSTSSDNMTFDEFQSCTILRSELAKLIYG